MTGQGAKAGSTTIYKGIAHQDTAAGAREQGGARRGRIRTRQEAASITAWAHGAAGRAYVGNTWSIGTMTGQGSKGGQYDHIQRHSTPGHGRTGAAAAAGA